jgi:purine-cytosine permease-like protein
MGMINILFLFIISGLIGRWVIVSIFDYFFDKKEPESYIDKSVHHHYNTTNVDNRSVHLDGKKYTINSKESIPNSDSL